MACENRAKAFKGRVDENSEEGNNGGALDNVGQFLADQPIDDRGAEGQRTDSRANSCSAYIDDNRKCAILPE